MDEQELAKKVRNWGESHRHELVQDLIHMIRYKSVTAPGENGYAFGTACKECADAAMEMGRSYGFSAENDDYYTISIVKPGKTEKEIGILGHLDVVPEGNGWNYDPFQGIEKDGFVIGRGSNDNKGGVMMSLYVMRCLKELGIELNHTVRLICGFNEESGMKDVEHYTEHHQAPEYTLVCDGGWAMCIGEKGILTADLTQKVTSGNLIELEGGVASNAVPDIAYARLKDVPETKIRQLKEAYPEVVVTNEGAITCIQTKGKSIHAFVPQYGINAIYCLYRLLCEFDLVTGDAGQAVRNLKDSFIDDYGTGLSIDFKDDISGETTVVGGLVHYKDGVISQNINVRHAIRQNGDEMLKNLYANCGKKNIVVENIDYSGPRYSPLDDPVTSMLLDTCHEFLGEEYEAYVMGGGTHARKFPNALPYGPGGIKVENPFGNPHGADEAVHIDSLIRSMAVYAVALVRMDAML